MIKDEVDKIVAKHGTNDPKVILDNKGIKVIFQSLGGKFAHKTTFKRTTIITLDNNLSEYEERYILAHELGHVVLHKGQSTTFYRSYGYGNIPKIEREANEFATLLLLYGKKYDNKLTILKENGIPYEMERFL